MSRHYMVQLSPYNTFNYLYMLYYNMLVQGFFFTSHNIFLLRKSFREQEEVFTYKFRPTECNNEQQ